MSFLLRKFLPVALVLLLAACASMREAPQQPEQRRRRPSRTGELTMDTMDAMNEIAAEELRREENALRSFLEVDTRPIHMQLSDQIQRVIVERTVIKPVYFPVSETKILTDDEVREMLNNMPTSRDLRDGVEHDERGLGAIIDNYKNILNASASCCPFRIVEGMRSMNFSSEVIVDFLERDSNGPSLQNMCIFASDSQISQGTSGARMGRIIRLARRNCVCHNAGYLRESLTNFYSIYRIDRDFYRQALIFHFRDANGRFVKHDMLDTVIRLTAVLRTCP